jgi:SHS family lactate transporter-like MFS transporter
MFGQLRSLNRSQRSAVLASFLGWTLDAFDYFILVFVIRKIASDFGHQVAEVTFAILVTLALRPIVAFAFGLAADRYGRRPTLMFNVALYSLVELASAFAPSLAILIALRGIYGIAMGGEWGVGASLVMETIPPQTRGLVSGILQQGYAVGYLLAALLFYTAFEFIGWRGMFAVGVAPALLVLFIRSRVEESPVWRAQATERPPGFLEGLRGRWPLFVYVVLLMTAFNVFSHGTQDLYPTFLQAQHQASPHQVGAIAILYNLGALAGGICFGALSERIGRRFSIALAATLALPLIPLWAFSKTLGLLAVGAFLLQFMVQGAWGVVPAHLNELSPERLRGTFPGFTYQLGNLLASGTATIQASLAARRGGDYGSALAVVAAGVAVAVALLAWFGPEARGHAFGRGPPASS